MDPLSVIASVVALLGLAIQIRKSLAILIDKFEDAPRHIKVLRSDVVIMEGAIQALEKFVKGSAPSPRPQDTVIPIDNLGIPIYESVQTLSEIHRLLKGFNPSSYLVMRHLFWARWDKRIMELLEDLQRHKLSLTLIWCGIL